MKIRLTVDSNQVAMPRKGALLVVLSEDDYVEVETGKGWVRRGAAAMRDVWRRYMQQQSQELVQIRK